MHLLNILAVVGSPELITIFLPLFVLTVLVVSAIPYWLIAQKAGYPGPVSLLMFVPIANIVVIWMFALADWPVLASTQAASIQNRS